MYLVINKCVTAVKISNFSGHYLPNRSTLDIGVLGYIGIVQHKEHTPEVLSIPLGTPCIVTCAMPVSITFSHIIPKLYKPLKSITVDMMCFDVLYNFRLNHLSF